MNEVTRSVTAIASTISSMGLVLALYSSIGFFPRQGPISGRKVLQAFAISIFPDLPFPEKNFLMAVGAKINNGPKFNFFNLSLKMTCDSISHG